MYRDLGPSDAGHWSMGASNPACYNEFAAMKLLARFSLLRLLLAGGAVILLA